MKKMENKQERPQGLKRKLMSALAMLLVSTILMSTTSYAWFVLSTAPEVTGIETQVGANGSLEIALLNKNTRADMSTIRAGLGGSSLQVGDLSANEAWGNLIDLGFQSYGLGELVLLPARLDVSGSEGSYMVNSGLLAVPSYGYDGRIIELTQDTATAIYQETGFLYSGAQEYGVRAIGTSDALSVQGSALSMAKSNISTYTKSAKTNTQSALMDNASPLMTIMMAYMSGSTYNDDDKAVLESMLTDLDAVLDYIDLALRQGLVAYGASQLSSEETFIAFRDRIMDTTVELPQLMQDLSELASVPEGFAAWVAELNEMQNTVNNALNQCRALEGGSYTWDQFKPILEKTINIEKVLINDKAIGELDLAGLMTAASITMTLPSGSGLFADIANFIDNYSVVAEAAGKAVEMKTVRSTVDEGPAYLTLLAAAVDTLEPADGGDDATALPLTATYGYALDLAFRCNAAMPDLVLQTKGVQRVYNGGEDPEDIESTNGTGQGGGSYMEFTSVDDSFTLEQRLKLMDAIRVGFVDDMGSLLGIAKLNVTSRETVDGYVRAPLYMYDYELTQDEHGMYLTMGERRLTDNLITPLEQNVAKAVTVIVWLDGDIVDNTMVSATKSASLDGVLNLQFATNAELVPAVVGTVLDYTPDKSGLTEAVLGLAETYDAGQGTFTNVSWNAFANAYNRAVSVNENPNASQIEIRNAVNNLSEAVMGLQTVSADAVNSKIEEIRQLMGSSGDTSRYVITDENGGYIAVGEASDEEKANWDVKGTITGVDYTGKNKNDEGNGIYTNVYSNETWDNLANALYNAEAVVMNPNATDDQINSALTALENAQKALARQVFYTPYEYNGDLYYMAICEADAEDTYGRWYDANFKRITADVAILNLDAYAVPAIISQVGQAAYVASDAESITPDIAFLEEVYPELRDVTVKGVKWDDVDAEIFTELMHQFHYDRLTQLMEIANTDALLQEYETGSLTEAKNAATMYITEWEKGVDGAQMTAEAVEAAISDLSSVMVDHYAYAMEQSVSAPGATMTSNQRILLSSAVNAAKGVEGYKDAANADLDALRAAAANAEKLLTAASVTGQQAVDALSALTAELDAVGVTVGGLIQSMPEGFNDSDFVYDVQYPGITLKLTGKSGKTTIGATVLTEEGVVIKVSKEITIYDRADRVKVEHAGNEITSLDLTVGGTADITAELFYEVVEGKALTLEETKSFKWASKDTAIAEVSGKEAGTATINAVAAGNTTISVSIETKSGNFYTLEISVNISE